MVPTKGAAEPLERPPSSALASDGGGGAGGGGAGGGIRKATSASSPSYARLADDGCDDDDGEDGDARCIRDRRRASHPSCTTAEATTRAAHERPAEEVARALV